MKELDIKVSATLPVIKGNFVEIRGHLIAELKQYDLIVDADSIIAILQQTSA